MSNQVTYEIYWLRFISCLSVVLIHAISSGIHFYDFNTGYLVRNTLLSTQLFFMFATPSFVFISEFLLSKAYPNGLKEGFFKTRVRYLLLPYFSMAFIYAVVFVDDFNLTNIAKLSLRHAFLGDFVAYFILIIFQFYILHYLLNNKLKHYKPKHVLLMSFLINALYLGVFVITNPSIDTGIINYFWSKGHWLLFPAWLFYFSFGYYAGRYYDQLLTILNKHKILVCIAPLVSFILLVCLTNVGFTITSKRADIIIHTTAVVLLILFLTSKINKEPPKIVLFISKYSFGIYLLHKLVIDTIGPISNNIFIHIISLFIIGVIFSIIVMFIFNKIPFGVYITGKIGKIKNKQQILIKEAS